MKHILSAIEAKVYHSIQFTKFCFSERSAQIKEARQLTKIGMKAFGLTSQSTRDDLRIEHFEPFVAHIYGIYYAAIARHDAIQSLALSGHGPDALSLLRSELETILTFLHVTEPQTDLEEVSRRTDKYRDWVLVKMKQNLEKSKKFELIQSMHWEESDNIIRENYNAIKEKYSSLPDQFASLEKMHSFLSRKERETIAAKFKLEGLYHHVYAESSATLHFADIGDRMRATGPMRYRYNIRHENGAFWPLLVSNIMLWRCIAQFGIFFGIDTLLKPALAAIFPVRDNSSAGAS